MKNARTLERIGSQSSCVRVPVARKQKNTSMLGVINPLAAAVCLICLSSACSDKGASENMRHDLYTVPLKQSGYATTNENLVVDRDYACDPGDLDRCSGVLRLSYKNSDPGNSKSAVGDTVLLQARLENKGFIDQLIVKRNGAGFPLLWYGEKVFPDKGYSKFGLSYRTDSVLGRPEELLKQIFLKHSQKYYDFLIKCLPGIAPGSISAAKSCEMMKEIAVKRPNGTIYILLSVDIDAQRLKDWAAIEKETTSFILGKLIVQ